MTRKIPAFIFLFISGLALSGCSGAVVGGAGTFGGHKAATDDRSLGTIVDDSVILTTIKSKMIADEFVKARHIDVDVLNRIVFLIGVVESSSQKRMAADIARSVEGVRKVENQLVIEKITSDQILVDSFLTSKIRAELIKTPDIQSNNIDVDTHNNIVRLTGVAGSHNEKMKIHQVVQDVAVNSKIVNNIKVGN